MNKEQLQPMLEAGVHLGYSRSRRHPSTLPFILGSKNRKDLINLEATTEQLEAAKEAIKKFATGDAAVMFVGTKPELHTKIENLANTIDAPFVTKRWIGGTLTNWSEIKKRVARLEDLRSQKESGELAKYTKKEQSLFDREINKLELYFGGLVNLKAKPGLVVVVDPKKEHLAVEEAIKLNIPVIAIANTDCDISNITYPVVANDSALSSVTLILNELVAAFKSAR